MKYILFAVIAFTFVMAQGAYLEPNGNVWVRLRAVLVWATRPVFKGVAKLWSSLKFWTFVVLVSQAALFAGATAFLAVGADPGQGVAKNVASLLGESTATVFWLSLAVMWFANSRVIDLQSSNRP